MKNKKPIISDRMRYFDSSGLRMAFQRAQNLKNPIDLSVGYPEGDTPDVIKSAGIRAIRTNQTRYTPTNGIPELRELIAQKLVGENSMSLTRENVTIVPGLTTGLLLVYMTLLNPGDEVIVIDPYYPPYRYLASMLGAKPILIDTFPDFQPSIEKIERAITDKTKLLVINSPNNPTGAVYSKGLLKQIITLANKHGLIILSDEIYEYFCYDCEHFSIGSEYEYTVTMNGFSKAFSMTGWRLGYLAGPAVIIDVVNELQQYTVFASSTIAQHAALAAFQTKPDLDTYKQKRELVREKLGKFVELRGMDGAFYSFFKLPRNKLDITFASQAVDNNVLVLPGRTFSSRQDYVRISYGTSLDQLGKGLPVLAKILQNK